jgi:hypothetical protein
MAARLGNVWLPRVAWTIGRAGLAGLALLLGAAVFLISTWLPLAAEIEALRADIAAPAAPARAASASMAASSVFELPARTDAPALLRQLFAKASQARLAVETAKYEVNAAGAIVRHQVVFPVSGPYAQIRSFVDATLAAMPAVALDELAIDRKSIVDGSVEAQIRMTLYTGANEAISLPRARAKQTEVVAPAHAAALFAQHSWYVLPPAPPPAAPPPPPAPSAPPFPYTCIGSFAPDGHAPVYFLAQGDRVVDAHVGDRLDGVYQFESADGGQLTFVYLPLDVRQTLPLGASR